METLWIQVKVDKRNGEIVMYDSSLPKEFFELCMDFKNKLQMLKDKSK